MMDIDKLKDLMGRATRGPWWPDEDVEYGHVVLWRDRGNDCDIALHIPKSETATLIAMAPDLAAEVIRLTAEHAQVVADNQAMATENARLVKRDAEARRLIAPMEGNAPVDSVAWNADARAFLAGEGK